MNRIKYKKSYTEFKAKLKEEGISIPFDMLFRELQFSGTIKRNNARLIPTVKCLININDPPFKVVELRTIDIVVFERLSRNLTLKN